VELEEGEEGSPELQAMLEEQANIWLQTTAIFYGGHLGLSDT